MKQTRKFSNGRIERSLYDYGKDAAGGKHSWLGPGLDGSGVHHLHHSEGL